MSFLNIEDPKKRDAIVADYLEMVKRLQKENLNEKTQDYLVRKDELKEMFNPVSTINNEINRSYHERVDPAARRIEASK